MGALAAACGDSEGSDGRPVVLASTALIAEFADHVVGEDARVETLIPSGVDLHSYEPPTDVARKVVRADLLLVNGCNLEGGLLNVIFENRRDEALLVVVSSGGDRDFATAEEAARADCDPHMWLDVSAAMRYVANIRGALSVVDPAHADGYAERADGYLRELGALDAELRLTLSALPPSRRRIVVLHDAFSYFAEAYEFELVASVLPRGSGQEPSAAAVAALVELVRREGVPAVFREPQFASRAVELVAEESGARVLTLFSAPLPGAAESYVELMRANARALVEGLGR
jgi:ABC-type Zn uptake system ZnuABC Zn-binding protein ZnuA